MIRGVHPDSGLSLRNGAGLEASLSGGGGGAVELPYSTATSYSTVPSYSGECGGGNLNVVLKYACSHLEFVDSH